jgi:hypothetical protein
MQCTECGNEQDSGPFCSRCGTRLDAARSCARCGALLLDGARFCTQCGAAASAARRARYAWPAALALLALLAGYWLGAARDDASPSTAGVGEAAVAPSRGTPPPLTGSMRDQADRLFERIMQARSRGDREEVEFFLPMALQAYDAADELDADGLFHLGLLQLEGGRTAEATATARRIRAADDTHLFGSALEAEAALAANDSATARAAFARFLAAFDGEIARNLPEYAMHRPALDEYREQAQQIDAS